MKILRNIEGLLRIGGNIGFLEGALAYLLPLFFYVSSVIDLKEIIVYNFKCQLLLFLAIVQLPLALTGKMAYVDIG